MSTQEHLKRIRARCVQLLGLAEKRALGKWTSEDGFIFCGNDCVADLVDGPRSANAAFIARCAGAAEAGWRSTIAAIDWITQFSLVNLSPCNGGSCAVAIEVDERLDSIRAHFIDVIVTAWPEELL